MKNQIKQLIIIVMLIIMGFITVMSEAIGDILLVSDPFYIYCSIPLLMMLGMIYGYICLSN